jgi:serine/threonine protein kinase
MISLPTHVEEMASRNRTFTVDRDNELGVGGFGQVCKGQFQGKSVAVKRIELIRLQRVNGDRELEIMKTLNHPNILKLLHWEDDNDFRLVISFFKICRVLDLFY